MRPTRRAAVDEGRQGPIADLKWTHHARRAAVSAGEGVSGDGGCRGGEVV